MARQDKFGQKGIGRFGNRNNETSETKAARQQPYTQKHAFANTILSKTVESVVKQITKEMASRNSNPVVLDAISVVKQITKEMASRTTGFEFLVKQPSSSRALLRSVSPSLNSQKHKADMENYRQYVVAFRRIFRILTYAWESGT